MRNFVVLVPVERGDVLVCDLAQLVERLDDDDTTATEAVEGAAIDESNPRDDSFRTLLDRVRVANETGDFAAYHGL